MTVEKHIPRLVEGQVREDLANFPVVLVQGARQVGKTTIARRICGEAGGLFQTLDEEETRSEAERNPGKFVSQADGERLLVIDEIQLCPKLIFAIKKLVDERRRPGMFLLTGSGDRAKMDVEANKLTGRGTSIVMRPLSQREIVRQGEGTNEGGGIVNAMAEGRPPTSLLHLDLQDAIAAGGYPLCVVNPGNKKRWLRHHFRNEIEVPIRQISKGESVRSLRLFLNTVAARLGKQTNIVKIANEMGGSEYTAKRSLDLLGDSFIVELVAGLRRKFRKKSMLTKPKLYLNDTGLATSLLGLDGQDMTSTPSWGPLVENFVLVELLKDLDLHHSDDYYSVSYLAENRGVDIDFVIDCGPSGGLIPIEVKAARKVWPGDIKGLYEFREIAGKHCKRAYVLYGGEEVVEFMGGIQAWPISSLWSS